MVFQDVNLIGMSVLPPDVCLSHCLEKKKNIVEGRVMLYISTVCTNFLATYKFSTPIDTNSRSLNTNLLWNLFSEIDVHEVLNIP